MTAMCADPVRRMLPALLLSALAAACTHPPPPTVNLAGRSCVPEPDLPGARPVALGGDSVKVALDDAAACWQPAGQPGSVYAVFRLPAASDAYLVWVTSEPIGEGLFSPRMLMLDEQGVVRREIARDVFTFHGATLRAGLRTRPGEAFLIVASDPQTVGQQVSQLASVISTSSVSSRGVTSTYTTGQDVTRTMTYAHNGKIIVSAEPVPQPR